MSSPTNFIAEDTTIKGNITTASSLTVAGAVEGDINAGGDVNILGDAIVRGDVSGPAVTIAGKVEGRVSASGKLVITTKGHVHGDIAVRSLLIEEGGTLQGQCHMGANASLPQKGGSAAPRPSSSPSNPSLTPASVPPPGTPQPRPVDR